MNHYKILEPILSNFFEENGIKGIDPISVLSAHGDKCYSYRNKWESAGIDFSCGVAIYLLSYYFPFSKEVRETKNEWVDPALWVIDNYNRFLPSYRNSFQEK